MNDREMLQAAFDRLEELGWVARADYQDCMTCAHNGILQEAQFLVDSGIPVKGVIFWHNQDDEDAFGYYPQAVEGEGGKEEEEENPWDMVLGDRMLRPLWLGWEDFSGDGLSDVIDVLVKTGFLVTPPADEGVRIMISTPAANVVGSTNMPAGKTAA
jgi:hypothetical protein